MHRWQRPVVKANGIVFQGYTDQQINLYGRYADLIVVAQSKEHNVLTNEVSIEDHILIDSARPILFIPYVGLSMPIGKTYSHRLERQPGIR